MAQKILITEEIVPAGIEILKEKGYEVDCKFDLSREELLDIIEDYDALIVRSATKVDREIFEIGKKLRVVGRAGVGIDNIDIEAANAYGVIVCNAPVSNTVSAAEHTMALMLAAARNVAAADACMKAGGWNRRDFTGTELYHMIRIVRVNVLVSWALRSTIRSKMSYLSQISSRCIRQLLMRQSACSVPKSSLR